jgi:hypothetical protein
MLIAGLMQYQSLATKAIFVKREAGRDRYSNQQERDRA